MLLLIVGVSLMGVSAVPMAQAEGQAGTGTVLGEISPITAARGQGVTGRIVTANANLPYPSKTGRSLRRIKRNAAPDFITVNEIFTFTVAELEGAVKGYDAYKDPVVHKSFNSGQSMNNAIMWRRDRWRMLDGGRVMIVQDDHVIFGGRKVRWNRYAIWGVFERISDGAVVSVISTHQMTNPNRSRQWGDQPFTRQQQYGEGMSYLAQLGAELSAYGPVLMGGDMNSHPSDGNWAAAPRMVDAGYRYTKDQGVMYQFFPQAVTVAAHRQIRVGSDHPVNITTLSMNGAGPLS